MKSVKIATWNVNSLRVRLPHVQQWLQQVKPDVLALQELKLPNDDFPRDAFEALGYHAAVSGQKTYNGVAVLSRTPVADIVTDIPGFEDQQRRVLAATVDGVRVINLYVPNGESVDSDKYQYKLAWLQHLIIWLKQELQQHSKVAVLGDFNIAPQAIDVHDPTAWDGHVLFSSLERQAFQSLLALGFHDSFREKSPEARAYSWWDYRMNAYKRNLGLRIDHILTSDALAATCEECYIDPFPRSWERPSDHTPVVAVFSI